MNVEELRLYALSKIGVEEGFPFGAETLVFKVKGKMFLAVGLNINPLRFNVKCDPELALELREKYPCVVPGYHMNKKHWNSVIVDHSLSNHEIEKMIDHSYNLILLKK